MNTRKKIIRQWCFYTLLTLLVIGGIMVACVNLVGVSYDQDQVNAGEVAIFRMNAEMRPIANLNEQTHLVIAFCAPKVWQPRENTIAEYENSLDPGVIMPMELIPIDISPTHRPGLTWETAMWNQFGSGPNVLDDMQWVAFWSVETMDPQNGQNMDITITIKAKTSEENLRAKLGFYLNYSTQGLESNTDYWGLDWGSCFEVINGQGSIIDFCDLHANMNQPGSATQDDIVTIKYLGGIIENDPLDEVSDIYLSATAYTEKRSYEKRNGQEDSKLNKEGVFGRTFGLTFWPVGYFGIPDDEKIIRIEYSFTNKDGTVYLMEQEKDDEGNVVSEEPFKFVFDCK